MWIVYAVAFCYGVSFVVVPAALNGLLKDLLPEDVLVEANASLAVTREALRLVGPLVGAATFALVGGGVVAMADAVTFLLRGRRGRGAAGGGDRDDAREPQHWRVEVVEGASFIRRTPLLLHPTVALALALLVIGFAESGGLRGGGRLRAPGLVRGAAADRAGGRRGLGRPGRQPGGPPDRGAGHRRAWDCWSPPPAWLGRGRRGADLAAAGRRRRCSAPASR